MGRDVGAAVDAVEMLFGSPLTAVSGCLRGTLAAAPGKILHARDYSNIEGRMTAWLAGETWKLQAFRDFDSGVGHDLYVLAYAKSFGVEPAEVIRDHKAGGTMRQTGKVQELALGFAGSDGALMSMAAKYRLDIPSDARGPIIDNWRAAHSRVVCLWDTLHCAAKTAMKNPGEKVTAHDALKIVATWGFHGDVPTGMHADQVGTGIAFGFWPPHLYMMMPSRGVLTYPFARLEYGPDPYNPARRKATISYGRTNAAGQWIRVNLWRGLTIENLVQAMSRDVFRDALLRAEARGLPVVTHSHDELVIEADPDTTADELEAVMLERAPYLRHPVIGPIPLAVAGWSGPQYKKD